MKKIPLLFCLFALPFVLSAQNRVDYGVFIAKAQGHSGLYRGELPMQYGSKAPNDASTYFAYSTDFRNGDVLFRGKLYTGVALNLNAHIDELYVKDPIDGIYILVNKNFVDFFSFGEHRFVHHKQELGSALAGGYYEVLYAGEIKLYKKIKKNFFENLRDGLYVKKGYTLNESFYFLKNDKWYRVGTKRELKKLYPEQTKTIDQIVKSRGLDFSNKNRERALIEIATHIDAL